MKNIFLILLFPIATFAQEIQPTRTVEFASRKQPNLFAGTMSFSPKGSMLLATFNDFGSKSVYELINLADGKTISTGSLRAIPYTVSWSDDEQLVALTFNKGNPGCFNVKGGMKETFTCSMAGQVAFSRNRGLLSKSETLLYVFGDESVNSYTITGKLKDSVEKDNDYKTYDMTWFDLLNNRFNLLNASDGEIATFSTAGKPGATISLPGVSDISADISDKSVDKDGSRFLCYAKNLLLVFDLATGKNILRYPQTDITAACFAPDSKAVMCVAKDKFLLIGMDGKLIASADKEGYSSNMAYTGFGTELVSTSVAKVDFYACKHYLPITREPATVKTAPKEKPVEFTPPVIIKDDVSAQETVKEKWNLPYTISDFITPKIADSFVLYNKGKSVKYMIKYKKKEAPDFLAKNPYDYFQFFGFGAAEKYDLGYVYTLDMGNGDAKITMYGDLTKKAGDAIIGGKNFFGKIPVSNLALVWDNKIYSDQINCSANMIDNVYKGKKAKCLVVKWGGSVNKTYFYQQAIGLIKIDAGGVSFER